MAKTTKTLDTTVRDYADRLILEKLYELHEVVKPSELSDQLTDTGLSPSVVRSLISSNAHKFAYADRRWVPAARIESQGRPVTAVFHTLVDRYGAPMPLNLAVAEVSRLSERDEDWTEDALRRIAQSDPRFFLTRDDRVGIDAFVFAARDESVERAYALNDITQEEVDEAAKKLGDFDWRDEEAIVKALEKAAPVNVVALGALAWHALNPQDPTSVLLYDWKSFNAELLSIPGFVYSSDKSLHPESVTKDWISATAKLSDKLESTIEVEDAVPLELKKSDIEEVVKIVLGSDDSSRATQLLEDKFEVTPNVKTFPDDLANMMNALKEDKRVWWVGGDRFRKPETAPDFVKEIPSPFHFEETPHTQEDGDPVDAELTEEGLSSSLRKLIVHPLATDVLDEDMLPAPKNQPEALRLVLKPIHRELGTFPMCQFPTGWFGDDPSLQELIFTDPQGNDLQVWLNHEARLLFNLFDWWLEQPVESGAVFQLTKTRRPNVFEFEWLDQTDPVVYISNQRMEELRAIADESEGKSTFQLLTEVMAHWPKGADFLTVLWELNVVRRTSRRMLASLLSSYVCFYQRSGSPVWHFDHKKVDTGFDKSKKKFIKKA